MATYELKGSTFETANNPNGLLPLNRDIAVFNLLVSEANNVYFIYRLFSGMKKDCFIPIGVRLYESGWSLGFGDLWDSLK